MAERPNCPDDGACHHTCGDGPCFRVLACGPLGRDDWTDAEKLEAELRRIAPDLGPKLEVQPSDGGVPRAVIRVVLRLPQRRTPAVALVPHPSDALKSLRAVEAGSGVEDAWDAL